MSNLKKLREQTGISFVLCKKALDQSLGDIEQAKKLLQQWGVEQTESKLFRKTGSGSMFSYIHHNKKIGVLLELLCETDFVAMNAEFQKLGAELSMQIASTNPKDVEELLKHAFIRDMQKTIEILIKEYIFKIGENIKIGRFARYEM